jgi:tRNA pseudouridine55 synthase
VARGPRERTASDSLVVIDKPSGMTSHDVVARVRRLAGTRKVGHAGTLDPMATGVLLVGIERTTRLLGHLALADKAYAATIRLGVATVTDDADGEVTSTVDASVVTQDAVERELESMRGDILQRPSSVSAIKVDGVRSYTRVREGEDVDLPARPVTVSRLEVLSLRRDQPGVVDVDVIVECSTGTYVRALARDLGDSLGVGGHLTVLRRTRVGAFGLDVARSLDELEESFVAVPLDDVVRALFEPVDVDEATADRVLHGGRLPTALAPGDRAGLFGPDGQVLSVAESRDGHLVPLVVFS